MKKEITPCILKLTKDLHLFSSGCHGNRSHGWTRLRWSSVSQGDQFHLMNSFWVRSWAFFVPIQLMQKVQNTAACLILRASRHQNCTRLLQQLHWLPVSERIKYKTACMRYNAITGSTPSDLSELLHFYSPSCSLHSSSDTRMLKIQCFNRKTCGFRTFSHFGPHIWNNIPQGIRLLFLPSKANSRHFSSQNISVKPHCPSLLSVCTVCACVCKHF